MIKVNKVDVQYEGTKALLLAEITTLLRGLHHKEGVLTEEDFDKMKEMVFKPEKELRKEALAFMLKDLDEFIDFLEKMAGNDETDD